MKKTSKKKDNNGAKQKNKSKCIDKLRNRIKNKRKSENGNTIDNNTIDNNTNESYDSKISDKIRDIRVILNRLGNIVTKNDKKKIKKEPYELENKNNLSNKEKKRFMIILIS